MSEEAKDAQAALDVRRRSSGGRGSLEFQRIGSGIEEHLDRLRERFGGEQADATIAERKQADAVRRRRLLALERDTWAIQGSGMAAKHRKLILAGDVDEKSGPCRVARAFIAGGDTVLGMLGVTGTGKTLGACMALWWRRLEFDEKRALDDRPIAQSLGESGSPAGMVISAPRYCRLANWEQPDHAASHTPFLVLDDVGREPDDKRADIDELLMTRADNDLLTIFTTNCDLAQLAGLYDDRFLSRLEDCGELFKFDKVLRKGRRDRC